MTQPDKWKGTVQKQLDCVFARFTYVDDETQFKVADDWRTYADQLLADPKYQMHDDCDSFAGTVIDLCSRAGISKENLYRLAVTTSDAPLGSPPNHMVGAVQDASSVWIVDCENKSVYPISEMSHTADVYNRMSEPLVWRKWVR